MIIDSHCHLNDEKLLPRVEEVIKAAKSSGVNSFLVVGWDKASSKLAISLAEKYEECYAIIGFHPENVYDINDDDFFEVMALANHPKVVGIGETGLDYYWCKDEQKREIQKYYFIKHIEYANKIKKPISIHNRDAYGDCLTILKEHVPYKAVMHCYSGSYEYYKEINKLNIAIGLGGTLTFKNANTIKDVCFFADIKNILVETDCPYLTPHPYRGQINEPKYLPLVINEIAKIKNLDAKEVEDIIYKNTLSFFGLDK